MKNVTKYQKFKFKLITKKPRNNFHKLLSQNNKPPASEQPVWRARACHVFETQKLCFEISMSSSRESDRKRRTEVSAQSDTSESAVIQVKTPKTNMGAVWEVEGFAVLLLSFHLSDSHTFSSGRTPDSESTLNSFLSKTAGLHPDFLVSFKAAGNQWKSVTREEFVSQLFLHQSVWTAAADVPVEESPNAERTSPDVCWSRSAGLGSVSVINSSPIYRSAAVAAQTLSPAVLLLSPRAWTTSTPRPLFRVLLTETHRNNVSITGSWGSSFFFTDFDSFHKTLQKIFSLKIKKVKNISCLKFISLFLWALTS